MSTQPCFCSHLHTVSRQQRCEPTVDASDEPNYQAGVVRTGARRFDQIEGDVRLSRQVTDILPQDRKRQGLPPPVSARNFHVPDLLADPRLPRTSSREVGVPLADLREFSALQDGRRTLWRFRVENEHGWPNEPLPLPGWREHRPSPLPELKRLAVLRAWVRWDLAARPIGHGRKEREDGKDDDD